MPTGILEVKIGSALQMPDRRFLLLLEQARRDCCIARNAAMTHWFIWRRQNPEWEPGGAYDAPKLKIKRKPKPEPEKKTPKDPPFAPREFLSRELYGIAVAAAGNLNTSVASSCVQEVTSRLKANTPYNHDGEARWAWQAILSSEVSLPTWRGGRIPMPRSVAKLIYTDDVCTIRFPLLSKKSGYKLKLLSPVVRLDAADLKRGNRRILRRLASGDLRMADSQIVERKGKWYVQFCYDVPVCAVDLPTSRVLTILPSLPDDRRPFTCRWIVEEDQREIYWGLGNGRPLVAEYRRVAARRRALRNRYKDGCGSGHGKKRWYKTIRPMSRYVIDMCSRFTKQTVADIISLAIRERCGSILYREPTMPVRDNSWFAAPDVPFDWTNFETRLAFKCEVAGIEYDKIRVGMGEWRPKKDAG